MAIAVKVIRIPLMFFIELGKKTLKFKCKNKRLQYEAEWAKQQGTHKPLPSN